MAWDFVAPAMPRSMAIDLMLERLRSAAHTAHVFTAARAEGKGEIVTFTRYETLDAKPHRCECNGCVTIRASEDALRQKWAALSDAEWLAFCEAVAPPETEP